MLLWLCCYVEWLTCTISQVAMGEAELSTRRDRKDDARGRRSRSRFESFLLSSYCQSQCQMQTLFHVDNFTLEMRWLTHYTHCIWMRFKSVLLFVAVVHLCITSRSPRRHSPSRSRRSRSGSGSRSRRSRFHRSRSRSRDRRPRDWRSPRSRSEERREREKERERRQKGLPPLKSKTLSGEYSLLQHVRF